MKIDVKHLWKTRKKLVIGIAAGVTAAAVGCGFWYKAGHSSSEPVYVFPFQYVGMTEYWGDSRESYGPVTMDKIQTVFLSDTQTVTEILVQAGDTVKKGDLLMTFDTTLSDLQLERKRLDVEKLKLQLQDAQEELRNINRMKPMVIPDFDDTPQEDADLGIMLTEPYRISSQTSYDGSSAEKALICWIRDDTDIDNSIFEAVRDMAARHQAENVPDETVPQETQPDETEPQETEPQETEPQETEPQETEPQETEPQETEPQETEPQETEPQETEPQETEPRETEPQETEPQETESIVETDTETVTAAEETSATATTDTPEAEKGCGASLSGAVLMSAVILAAGVCMRKKED